MFFDLRTKIKKIRVPEQGIRNFSTSCIEIY